MLLNFKIAGCAFRTGDQNCLKHISTGCSDLNGILGGGFAHGEVTELFGPPGSGRTQLALTVCAYAIADGGTALYVDADGSIVPSRVRELIASVNSAKVKSASLGGHGAGAADDHKSVLASENVDTLLANFLTCRVCSWEELTAGVAHKIPEIVEERKDVSVVVIDSIALPYRNYSGKRPQRALELFVCKMMSVAMSYNVVVLLINNAREVDFVSRTAPVYAETYQTMLAREVGIPAMGDSFAYLCPCRLGLGWREREFRVAHLVKSSRMPRASALFDISASGVSNEFQDSF